MTSSNTTKALRKLTLATTTAAMALGMVSALEGYAQTGGTGGEGCVQEVDSKCTLIHERCENGECTYSYVTWPHMKKFGW